MTNFQRALVVIAFGGAIYVLFSASSVPLPIGNSSSSRAVVVVLVGALGAWLGRSIYRSRLTSNPLGNDRDFSLRPAAIAALKALCLFVASLAAGALGAYCVKHEYIPDSPAGATLALGPGLLLLLASIIYLVIAAVRFQFGRQPPGE